MQDSITYMTTQEFSDACGQPVKKITNWLRQGVLEGVKESGKWRIPTGQLARVRSGGDPAPNPPAGETPAGGAATGEKTYSVEEFSAMTFLTPFGVTDWLKRGRLTGRRGDDGKWRVDARNLESDRMRRLLR